MLNTAFSAEQVSTRDEVPLNVDAAVSWHLHRTKAVKLPVADRRRAIGRIAQAALRKAIGSSTLATLLCDRRLAERWLSDEIARKTLEWGVTVCGVEIRRLAIPAALQAECDARLLVALRSFRRALPPCSVGRDQGPRRYGQGPLTRFP